MQKKLVQHRTQRRFAAHEFLPQHGWREGARHSLVWAGRGRAVCAHSLQHYERVGPFLVDAAGWKPGSEGVQLMWRRICRIEE
jgi:hypothetical protein